MSAETVRILDRVKKMLALANDKAATEGERDNAMRMAYATLAKYNLSMAQVNVLDNDRGDPRAHVILELDPKDAWSIICAGGIAQLFFCQHFRQNMGGDSFQHVFVGKTVNTSTASYMSEFVINSIKKQADKATKDYFGEFKLDDILGIDSGETPEAGKKLWAESFRIGAAKAIKERCVKMRKEASEDNAQGTGTSLVLASMYDREGKANMEYISQTLGINLRSISVGASNLATGAAAKGAAFGNTINLNRQIGSGSSTLRLGKK